MTRMENHGPWILKRDHHILNGFRGCQGALINVPAPGAEYPLSITKSVLIIGGEQWEPEMIRGSWVMMEFASTFGFDTGEWRSDAPVPPMAVQRTAMALCVGAGRVVPQQ